LPLALHQRSSAQISGKKVLCNTNPKFLHFCLSLRPLRSFAASAVSFGFGSSPCSFVCSVVKGFCLLALYQRSSAQISGKKVLCNTNAKFLHFFVYLCARCVPLRPLQ